MKISDLEAGDVIKFDGDTYRITEIDHTDQSVCLKCRDFDEYGQSVSGTQICDFKWIEGEGRTELVGRGNVFWVNDLRANIAYRKAIESLLPEQIIILGDDGHQVTCPDDVWDEFFEMGE